MLELTDELMEDIDKNTYNNIAISKMKVLKNNLIKKIKKYNSYIKHEIEKKNILKIIPNQILKIIPNQILKITPNQLLK